MDQVFVRSDLAFGAIVIVVLIALGIITLVLLQRARHTRVDRIWHVLAPFVGGRALDAGQHGEASALRGVYHGHALLATSTPEPTDNDVHTFTVTLFDVAGLHDWQVARALPRPAGESVGWHLRCDDAETCNRLEAEDVVELIAPFSLTITYQARARTLHARSTLERQQVPGPERFRAELDLLAQLITINARTNPPEPAS